MIAKDNHGVRPQMNEIFLVPKLCLGTHVFLKLRFNNAPKRSLGIRVATGGWRLSLRSPRQYESGASQAVAGRQDLLANWRFGFCRGVFSWTAPLRCRDLP